MSCLVIGGAGFIGRRVVRLLAERGESVVAMDIEPVATSRNRVRSLRGDVTQFDQVMAAVRDSEATCLLNLSYLLGNHHPPHLATRLNVIGLDNCLEAARLCNVDRVVYASSLAVNGLQRAYGERMITEDDVAQGSGQYPMHKLFNEWQAQDYREKYGMTITGIRPAHVTGPDKSRGVLDHVDCITLPARGQPVRLPYADTMRCPIHVDDVAEVFARVLLAPRPLHALYNTGGTAISLGGIAAIVRSFLPAATIAFDQETGGREESENYLIDNSRLLAEFAVPYSPYRERVLQIVNDVRREDGHEPIAA